VTAWWFYLKQPAIPRWFKERFAFVHTVLDNKYYMDWLNEHVLAAGARLLGVGLWKGGDQGLIDGAVVNGSARAVGSMAGVVRLAQTGYLYWYALVMILGVFGLMTWQLWPYLSSLFGR
jgi:NADH-quinone oxidoreductase subunit L